MSMVMTDYNFFMAAAYEQALLAFEKKEAPIGCVIVHENEIIGRGYNMRNANKNVLGHAELVAINEASERTGDWRLEGAVLFVTVEPCPMCAGAIIQARVNEVVYGAENKKAGCGGSVVNLFEDNAFNHRVKVTRGVMERECSELMSLFFSELRSGGEL